MTGFYQGYKSAMDLHVTSSRLGSPTSAMTAKQLEEFGKRLNEGVKNIEIGPIGQDKFETIPLQHFDEIRRLAKLTDTKPSLHAPIVDLAGFSSGEQGSKWREEQRVSTEQQVVSILERAYKLTNGENVPVVFHAGNTFSQEYGVPYDEKKHPDGLQKEELYEEDGKMKRRFVATDIRALGIVNQDTGEMTRLDHEKKFRLGSDKQEIWDPEKRLRNLNATQWEDDKLKLLQNQKEVEELKEKMLIKLKQNEAIKKTNLDQDESKGYKAMLESNALDIDRMQRHIIEINRKVVSEYDNVYHKFQKFAPAKAQEEFKEGLGKMNENFSSTQKEIDRYHKEIDKIERIEEELDNKEEIIELRKLKQKKAEDLFTLQLKQSKQVITDIAHMPTPEIWKPVGEFAKEKTAQTVASAMAQVYKTLQKEGKQDKTPFIAMENFFVHSPMSRAKELKEAVELSREKLAQELVNKCGLDSKKAKQEAEKLIGATWDVGHINNLRKAGYEGEELKQKVIAESKEISDVIKHVHLTDNFGFFDSHLPPGMGNVPIPEIMEMLEKKWAKLDEEGKLHQKPRAIIEAGGFVAEVGQNPQLGVLEYFGSPLYKLGQGEYFWGNKDINRGVANGYSGYMESFTEFPSQHFNMYGSSFTTLPKTVGGQVGDDKSRFSGTPNQ